MKIKRNPSIFTILNNEISRVEKSLNAFRNMLENIFCFIRLKNMQ